MKTKIMMCVCVSLAILCGKVDAGAKRIISMRKAEILAERNIVETVYGIKIKFTETVVDIINGSFEGNVASKTGVRHINGIKFEEKFYDKERDIAKVVATVRIGDIQELDPAFREMFKDKVIRRVAFSTSTKSQQPKLAALRAATVDAYKNLVKIISGFTLESKTSIKDFMLKSDSVKTAVLGAVMGAEIVDYRWEGEDNDAVVKVHINVKEFQSLLPEHIVNHAGDFIEAEGYGASINDMETTVTPLPKK